MKPSAAAIVGVSESDLGITGKSKLELQLQAITRALDDAGLTPQDVDGLATNDLARFSTVQMAEYLGIQPKWTDSSVSGGATYEMFVARAAEMISSGICETVLVSYGSNQRSAASRKIGGVRQPGLPVEQFETPYGPLAPMSMYALAAQRHMHDFGTTPEQLAEVAVAARAWALKNPKAYRYRAGPLTVQQVVSGNLISSPLHSADCCLVTDGGGAVIVTPLERARDLRDDPIVVLGHGENTTHISMTQMPDLTSTGAVESGRRAFAMAGLSPDDVDVAEVYDSFTITVMLSLEALGFCEKGASGEFVSGGRIAPGGSFSLNTSGGGLSYCHPGQFGILLVVEAVRQLRGEADQRQVDSPEVALCHGTGGHLSTHATLLLGVDR